MENGDRAPDWGGYVDQTAKLLDLPIPKALRPGVIENFERIVAIAQPVLDFPLDDTDEPAPAFEP
ncbi:MAG: DUF4089 domain-containing protein [Leptolyngbya sp. RL_3_1]|nr:DUF4089 domain-containing protein [Leptolyngbya sp. RL_3_1]